MAKVVAVDDKEIQGGFASNDGDGMHPKLNTYEGISKVNETVEARPGYFALSLNTSIHVDMTVTDHVALYRFTFPTNGTPTKRSGNATQPKMPYSPLILVDLTDLSNSRSNERVQVDSKTGRIVGFGTFSPFFGIGTYNSFFCADFHGADSAEVRDTGVFMNSRAASGPKTLRLPSDGNVVPGACRNAEQEIPDFDLDKDYTSRILPTRQNREVIHALTSTDENPLWDSEEPYFDSYYWIWGSFRSTHPLITLVDLDSQALMVHSLIDIFRHEGKAASSRTVECLYARVSQYHSGRHCGSKADNLLADSYVKGLQSNIDWETAYTAVISDADGWEDAGLESSELVFGDCFEESSEEEDEVDAEIVDREEY
ncbi:hypothetical protein E4U15_003010 [Claviceps sp. LM218 group G6]|nr:hypothetical protein E4U15_003010 [Claviceps sp. LM218 group G6]